MNILRVLRESKNPVSTREIAVKIKNSWATVNSHCLRLQVAGKIEEIKMSGINFWRMKR